MDLRMCIQVHITFTEWTLIFGIGLSFLINKRSLSLPPSIPTSLPPSLPPSLSLSLSIALALSLSLSLPPSLSLAISLSLLLILGFRIYGEDNIYDLS
jgi:hypothetical protein